MRHELAARLRAERAAERFSQEQLADELGIGRTALANYEYASRPLPFTVGLAWCRRLDINPRWLAEGLEPKRPFVKPQEAGVAEGELQALCSPRCSFLHGYDAALAAPFALWVEKHPPEEVVYRMINAGPEGLARRLSLSALEKEIERASKEIIASNGPDRIGWIRVLRPFLDELEHRTGLNRSKNR